MILVKSVSGGELRVDGYRVRIFERLELPPVDQRLRAIREAGWNTFLLKATDVFLDMLTDSGVNAMSDRQPGRHDNCSGRLCGKQSVL